MVSPAASSQEVPAKSPGRGWVRVTCHPDRLVCSLVGLLLGCVAGGGEGDDPLDRREPEPVDPGGELLVDPPGTLQRQGSGLGRDPAGLPRRHRPPPPGPRAGGAGAAGPARRPSGPSRTGWRPPSRHRTPRPRTAPHPGSRHRPARRRSRRARADQRRPRSPYPIQGWPGAERTTGRPSPACAAAPTGPAARPRPRHRAGRHRRGPRPRTPRCGCLLRSWAKSSRHHRQSPGAESLCPQGIRRFETDAARPPQPLTRGISRRRWVASVEVVWRCSAWPAPSSSSRTTSGESAPNAATWPNAPWLSWPTDLMRRWPSPNS